MRRRVFVVSALGILASGLGLLAPSAAHAATSCTTGQNGVFIADDVEVPAGASCNLANSRVTGNIAVGPGAHLILRNTQVDRNVSTNQAVVDIIAGSRIGGDVNIVGATNVTSLNTFSDSGALCGSTFGGNVNVSSATVSSPNGFGIGTGPNCVGTNGAGNTIRGTLSVVSNRVQVGIVGNTVGAYLSCFGNVPPPTGSANTALSKQGQCAGL